MNLKENWDLRIDDRVEKRVARFPENDQERIRLALRSLVGDPFLGDCKKMQGEKDVWRRRIGAYRIFYELHTKQKVIHVVEIQRRASKTY